MKDTASVPPEDCLPSASLQTLRLRSCLLQTLRRTFEEHGYWEVETPLLSHETIIDAHLEPMRVAVGSHSDLFLQTSPELGMKRLIAGGANAIYQITRAVRAGEVGQLHNPEFTLVEWYRTGTTYHEQMNFTEQLVTCVLETAIANDSLNVDSGPPPLPIRQNLRPDRPFARISYDQAFERFTGTRVLHLSAKDLAQLARRHSVAPPESLRQHDCDEWLNLLLTELVEPHLGSDKPVFLYDYPASQSALARVRNEEPPVAERFELYIRGMELCNGYNELTDSDELRTRMTCQNGLRSRENRVKLPMPVRLLDAHDYGLPSCSGVALGFDRLVMLCVGATSIAEVLAFPFDRA